MTHIPSKDLITQLCRQLADTLLVRESRLKIVLFGSRAAGTHNPRSDFDLGFDAGHPLKAHELGALREAFESLKILEAVDVVDLAAVDEGFRAVATCIQEVIYER